MQVSSQMPRAAVSFAKRPAVAPPVSPMISESRSEARDVQFGRRTGAANDENKRRRLIDKDFTFKGMVGMLLTGILAGGWAVNLQQAPEQNFFMEGVETVVNMGETVGDIATGTSELFGKLGNAKDAFNR